MFLHLFFGIYYFHLCVMDTKEICSKFDDRFHPQEWEGPVAGCREHGNTLINVWEP
jgi:hypothetical protein